MDLRVRGPAPPDPFLGARDLFETEFSLDRPVTVRVRSDPEERTRVGHGEDGHVLTISRQAATSAMARELALHEFAHMHRHEEAHPSHTLSTEEALFLALPGRSVERAALAHCYQIANHTRDVYADDITLSVAPADKLAAFLESELAAAVADRPAPLDGVRITAGADPEITAVNAAFALALLERHDAVTGDHPIYDLAHAAERDAPEVAFETFREGFRSLARDPDESDFRRTLVSLVREYVDARATGGPAAD
jgi:hypothetical protein